jgi:hypothetical protein
MPVEPTLWHSCHAGEMVRVPPETAPPVRQVGMAIEGCRHPQMWRGEGDDPNQGQYASLAASSAQ